jgi:hypothetical protein
MPCSDAFQNASSIARVSGWGIKLGRIRYRFRALERTGNQLGISLETPSRIVDLCTQLQNESDRLAGAMSAIEDFCAQNGIPFDGSRSKFAQLTELARAVTEAPEELLHLQSAGLTRDGSHHAIETLAKLQGEWADASS